MPPFLQVDRISKHYRVSGGTPVNALDDVSFTAQAGEWIAIMGPSGSGKTTLLNILGCLDQPSSGSVHIGSTDISKLTRAELVRFRAETVGLIFQQYHLIPHLTALENVMLAQYFHSMTDESEARRALDHVGLAERSGHLPSQLSGGEQQRVAIARALALRPEILLLDEVTAALDPELVSEVLDSIRALAREGMTMLIVSHEMGFIREVASKVAFMANGKVVEMGPPAQIFDAPREARTREFVSKILRH
jgi:polar amino acid transport system ATP-binding protein